MLRLIQFLCAFLVIVLVAIWMRSVRYADAVEFTNQRGWSILLSTTPGRVHISWPSAAYEDWHDPLPRVRSSSTARNPGESGSNMTGGDWKHALLACRAWIGIRQSHHAVDAAIWPLVILAGIWPIGRRIWKASRRRRGLCRECGYDLRATRERCPECGAFVIGASEGRRSKKWWRRGTAIAGIALGVCWFSSYDFHATRVTRIDFAALAGFAFDDKRGTLADIPPSVRQLDGKHIAIDGYAVPMEGDGGTYAPHFTTFALLPKTAGHGLDWRVPQVINAHVMNDRSLSCGFEHICVRGTLHVAMVYDRGSLIGIYSIDVDDATPADDRNDERTERAYNPGN